MQINHTICDSGHNNEVIVWGEGRWGSIVCFTSCELQKKSSVLFFNFNVRRSLSQPCQILANLSPF